LSVSCLTNNLLTPDLPVKVPALTTLQVNFADSITAAQQGGKVETAKKNIVLTDLTSTHICNVRVRAIGAPRNTVNGAQLSRQW
jgi:hypothetical protein